MNLDLIKIVSSLLVGLVLPFAAEYFNNIWKLNGDKALALAGLLSAILTVVSVAIVGWLTGTLQDTFQPEHLMPLFLLVYGTGQTVFQLIKTTMGWTSIKPVG